MNMVPGAPLLNDSAFKIYARMLADTWGRNPIQIVLSKFKSYFRREEEMASKQELVRFLDERVFDPILRASPDKYHGRQQEELKDVQQRTRQEKERYHRYGSAEKVVQMFKDDLSSENARPVNEKLHRLGLPRLVDVKDEFEKKAA